MKLFEKLNNVRKNKKGFTLVELVVVIIILAILAAILIPSFLGYMNKAQNSQKHVQARSVYLAANTIAAEMKYENFPGTIASTAVTTPTAGSVAEKIKNLIPEIAKDTKFVYNIKCDSTNKTITVEYKLVEDTDNYSGKIPTDPAPPESSSEAGT